MVWKTFVSSEVSAQEEQQGTPVESNNDTKKKGNNKKKADNKVRIGSNVCCETWTK